MISKFLVKDLRLDFMNFFIYMMLKVKFYF